MQSGRSPGYLCVGFTRAGCLSYPAGEISDVGCGVARQYVSAGTGKVVISSGDDDAAWAAHRKAKGDGAGGEGASIPGGNRPKLVSS